jgi:hypothetical protein
LTEGAIVTAQIAEPAAAREIAQRAKAMARRVIADFPPT